MHLLTKAIRRKLLVSLRVIRNTAMRYLTRLLRALFECRNTRRRQRLPRYHVAYLRKHYPYQRYTWGWRQTSTMVASKVFAPDGNPEAIVTTLLLDGRIWHTDEPCNPPVSLHNKQCPVHEHCDGACGDAGHN